jgi:hypothetical protein
MMPPAEITQHQGEGGGKATAGAPAENSYLHRIDVQPRRIGDEPVAGRKQSSCGAGTDFRAYPGAA